LPWLLAARRKKLRHLHRLLPLKLLPLHRLLLLLLTQSLLTLLRPLLLLTQSRLTLLRPLLLLMQSRLTLLRQNNLQIIFRKTGPLGRFFFACIFPFLSPSFFLSCISGQRNPRCPPLLRTPKRVRSRHSALIAIAGHPGTDKALTRPQKRSGAREPVKRHCMATNAKMKTRETGKAGESGSSATRAQVSAQAAIKRGQAAGNGNKLFLPAAQEMRRMLTKR